MWLMLLGSIKLPTIRLTPAYLPGSELSSASCVVFVSILAVVADNFISLALLVSGSVVVVVWL